MNQIELIRQEVERLKHFESSDSAWATLCELERFLDTIQEQPVKTNIVEDLKHYLATTPKDQIKKDWESLKEWDKVGPSVSEFLGWEHPVCEGLEEEHLNPFEFVAGCIDDTLKEKAKEVSANEIEDEINRWMGSTDCLPEDVGITPLPKVMEIVERTARHFAKWQKEQNEKFEKFKEYTDNALISIEEAREQGRQEMKEQMMKEAVETWMLEGSMFEPEFIKRKVIIIKEDKQ